MAGDGPPLSLRPIPVANREPKNLAEFIAWANQQPGGFRALDEVKLREQIAADQEAKRKEENGEAPQAVEDEEDVDMEEELEEDDGDVLKDAEKAREEVLKNVDIAGNNALLTLDFLSLLLSKVNPTQASMTLSQQLREMVGIGTVGADRLDDSNITEDRIKDQESTAVGRTLMEINKNRDAAELASTFLQRELAAEGKYWEEVMAVQKSGWSICKVPMERHTLGVRFGFSEAAPDFRNNGLAPMRRGEDGSVQLDIGRLGGVSERIRVTYTKDGQVQGQSHLPAQTLEDAPLEDRVLEARNTIFSQELWHELSKEARSLASYDVRVEASRLVCALEPGHKITVQLVPLGPSPQHDETLQSNHFAETISQSLHLLSSYAHRNNELMRTRPMPPHITRSRGQQMYTLLRPIIARMTNIRDVGLCAAYIGGLVKSLQKAGWPASFILRTSQTPLPSGDAAPNQPSTSVMFARSMLQPIDFTFRITLLPNTSLTIRGRTFLFPVITTLYNVLLPAESPITPLCAPYKDGYPDLPALADYLRTVTARLLTDTFLSRLPSEKEWSKTISGTSIRDLDREDFELSFTVEDVEDKPVITVSNTCVANGKLEDNHWTWPESADAETRSMSDVIDQLIKTSVLNGRSVGVLLRDAVLD